MSLFSNRGQQRLAAALVVLCLLPFVVLAFDSHPALDDFSDAVLRRRLGFWAAQRELYQGWTGRFTTSVFLMDASPLRWAGEWPRYYFLVGWSALLALAGGLYACWTALTGAAWSRWVRLLATGVVLALWLAQAASVAECLYWYNAVAVYTWPAALLLWWLVALVRLLRTAPGARNAFGRGLVAAMLAVAVVGSNEVAALVVLAGLGYAALWAWYRHRYRLPVVAGLLAIALLAAAVSFLAPGNGQRLSTIAHQPQLLRALAGSVAAAVYFSLNWLGTGLLLAATALALPALARLIARPNSAARSLSHVPPLWLATGLLLVLVLVNMPSYWATGGMMPLRARAVVWLFFLIGWLALLLAALGAATRHWPPLPAAPGRWLAAAGSGRAVGGSAPGLLHRPQRAAEALLGGRRKQQCGAGLPRLAERGRGPLRPTATGPLSPTARTARSAPMPPGPDRRAANAALPRHHHRLNLLGQPGLRSLFQSPGRVGRAGRPQPIPVSLLES